MTAATGLLFPFAAAGVLRPADVHVARRLLALAGEADPEVELGVAFAVRAPRLGHVYVDLGTIATTATSDAEEPVDLAALPWPAPAGWVARLAASGLVARDDAEDPEDPRPLRLVGTALYLDRYWRDEGALAELLTALRARPAADVRDAALADGLVRLFPSAGEDDRQRLAAETVVRRRFAVIAGGPGTGKTTTVARVLALLDEQAAAAGGPPPLVALAAPTGKAAARLAEAVHEEAARLPVAPAVRDRLLAAGATTLHRLLGTQPGNHTRFRHGRGNHLPHDVVVVDETSMVSLSLMVRLCEAVRPDARLVLVGDPDQLASVEAGAVLGDVVGPAAAEPPAVAAAGGIVVLDRVHRFGAAIARVADAIRRGDPDAAVAALRADGITWLRPSDDDPAALPDLAPVRSGVVVAARAVLAAARAGDAATALAELGAFRVLCAHRRGPYGVAAWTARIEGWLRAADALDDSGEWSVGRPLLVTENDAALRLYNGDTGVIVATGPGEVRAAFERRGGLVLLSPARLSAIDTVHAMTIHKSQGSQFTRAAVVLPEPGSPLLTRELLYTAVTRARDGLLVVGTEAAVRAAAGRPVARASGLRERLRTSAAA
jgi:exodeoxyribonuclease V alpha subunit